MMYFQRTFYVSKIVTALHKPVIKVITGMRRTGKSTLLKQVITHIKEHHFTDDDVLIFINKESLDRDFIRDYTDLHKYIEEQTKNITGRIYLFVDEVQLIENRQKTILHRYNDERVDIYIT